MLLGGGGEEGGYVGWELCGVAGGGGVEFSMMLRIDQHALQAMCVWVERASFLLKSCFFASLDMQQL